VTTLQRRVDDLNAIRRDMTSRLNGVDADIRTRRRPMPELLAEMGRIGDLGRQALLAIATIRCEHRHLPKPLRARLAQEAAWLTDTTAMADRYAARAGEARGTSA